MDFIYIFSYVKRHTASGTNLDSFFSFFFFVVFFQFLFVSSNKNWNCYVYASYVYCNKLGKNAIPRSRKIERRKKNMPNCFRLIRAKVKDAYIPTKTTTVTTILKKKKKRQTDTQSKVFSFVYIRLVSLSLVFMARCFRLDA